MSRLHPLVVLALLAVVVAASVPPSLAHSSGALHTEAAGPLVLQVISPAPNSTISSSTPTISVGYSDAVGTLNSSSVSFFVDGLNVSATDLVNVTTTAITYSVPSILKLPEGGNNASVVAIDSKGNTAKIAWNFTVTPVSAVAGNPFAGL